MDDETDSWTIPDIVIETEQNRPSPFASVTTVVDANGGECRLGDIVLFVPPGAVSSPTAISADMYMDDSVTPPSDSSEHLAVLSAVLQLSPAELKFNVPVELLFRPHVPLKSSSPESGCQLKLKMTNNSLHDPERQWLTALEINTITGNVAQPLDVLFDSKAEKVQLRHFSGYCWMGKMVDVDQTDLRGVMYAAFGKQLERHRWMILLDVMDCTEFKDQSIVETMKTSGFISLIPPTTGIIHVDGEVVLNFECNNEWEISVGNKDWVIYAKAIGHQNHCTIIVEDPSALSKSLTITVKASCSRNGRQLEALCPTTLIIGHPLEQSSQISRSSKRDHFHALVVCAQEFELQAARSVFEMETKNTFVQAHNDLPFNLRVCRDWMSSRTNVALVAQPNTGGIECMKLLAQLAQYFSADLIAMTGTCAGEENKYLNIEHGTVVIAERTTTVSGGKVTADGRYRIQAQYKDLDRRLAPSLKQLVEEEVANWIEYVPEAVRRPSPRYVRELILKEVMERGPNGITNRKLLNLLEDCHIPGMTRKAFYGIIYTMLQRNEPWLHFGGDRGFSLLLTEEGEKYVRNAAEFPRKDNLSVLCGSMGAISHESDILDTEMPTLKKQMGDWDLKGIDQESHYFLEQASQCFSPGLAVVMKGISDYGTRESKLQYYQRMAASTSAAFLRHFLVQRNSQKSKLPQIK